MSQRRTPVRRKIAVATWRPSRDGRIYARMEVDATATLAYLERIRAESGERVTVTHVVGAALGRAIRQVPEIRARIVLGRLLDLDTCDVGFAVDIEQGADLAPVKVHDVGPFQNLQRGTYLAFADHGPLGVVFQGVCGDDLTVSCRVINDDC